MKTSGHAVGRGVAADSVALGAYRLFIPVIKAITKMTKKMKNRILAASAAPAAMPPKPKTPATIATRKKIAAHFNMLTSLPGPDGRRPTGEAPIHCARLIRTFFLMAVMSVIFTDA